MKRKLPTITKNFQSLATLQKQYKFINRNNLDFKLERQTAAAVKRGNVCLLKGA